MNIRDPKFNVVCKVEIQGQPEVTFLYEGEKPKELMDAFQEIIGDAKATVSVSTDMGVKKFGSGASAMVTVSLTCNQDSATIARAAELAAGAGRHYVKHYQQLAENELRAMLQAQNRQVEF